MTDAEYAKLALRTEHTPAFVTPQEGADGVDVSRAMHGAIGLCTEVGELQDALKRHLIYSADLDRVNVIEECGDILWYLQLVLTAAGSSLTDAKVRNISKLQARFPDRFTAEAATVRDLQAERAALEGAPHE